MQIDLNTALQEASGKADLLGESFCVVSGMKNNVKIYRIYALKAFGLPPGGILEEVVTPKIERTETEPTEKTSTNGF